MTVWIVAYFLGGAAFGWATYAHKHLFSEGPEKPADPLRPDPMNSRLAWMLICSCLWPVMVLTGVYSFWRLRQRRARTPDDQNKH